MWPFQTKTAPVEETKASSDIVSPEGWFVAHFGGGPDDIAATAHTALQVPAVASAIRLISEAAASLDVRVQRKVGGVWKDVPNHPAVKLLNNEANEWTSGFELTRGLLIETLTSDPGGFALVTRSSDNRPIAIRKYKPGIIQVEFSAEGDGQPLYKKNGKALRSSDVIHVRNAFNTAPISHARDAIAFARGLQAYGRQLFQNGARPGGLLKTTKPIGDRGVEAMLKGWTAAFSGSQNAGKTPVLWDGTDYTQLGLSSTDAQFLENRRFQNEEIARAFRVPPTMIFDLERGTWGNAEQMGREFLTYCLEPWLRELEGAYGRALLTDDERRNHRILFDRDDLTRASLTERATAVSSLISNTSISPNEARTWLLDLPPREGGDVYQNPAIQVQAQEPTAETKPAA
ncbi:phage portal protein [Falsochrobactrum shanghaiense]|uniref:Phage portal protein n=1 Tax=Falsochrobactrum shanghaiense TaxID=2201899 RepID=A0A316JCX5_9HYPH|nr:phage portal protein [Falsochrobactrum shanghaiense]PWL19266.1 phage portal protein [Falsochrobactrum shanghaiense]